MIFIYYQIIEIPILIAFNDEFVIPTALLNFQSFLFWFFVFEIVICFNTAYYTKGFKI